jgi:hypothetical protein
VLEAVRSAFGIVSGFGAGSGARADAGILWPVIRGVASYRANRGFAELTALAETLAGAV